MQRAKNTLNYSFVFLCAILFYLVQYVLSQLVKVVLWCLVKVDAVSSIARSFSLCTCLGKRGVRQGF